MSKRAFTFDVIGNERTGKPVRLLTARKPVVIHSLAFGTLFEPNTSSSDKSTALGILQNVAARH